MITDLDIHIGRQIRRRRIIMDMTQQELADKVGVCFQAINKYECAANRLSVARFYDIARALETPPSYFFETYGVRVAA